MLVETKCGSNKKTYLNVTCLNLEMGRGLLGGNSSSSSSTDFVELKMGYNRRQGVVGLFKREERRINVGHLCLCLCHRNRRHLCRHLCRHNMSRIIISRARSPEARRSTGRRRVGSGRTTASCCCLDAGLLTSLMVTATDYKAEIARG